MRSRSGEILQVLLFSVLFGLALLHARAAQRVRSSHSSSTSRTRCSRSSACIMRLAPIGAFGAMAFTIGQYGIGTLLSLGKLMAGVYVTCAPVHLRRARARSPRLAGLQPVQVPPLHQRRDPDRARHVVVGVGAAAASWRSSSSSDAAKSVVGLVVPTGLFLQSRRHVDLHDDGARCSSRRRAACTCRSAQQLWRFSACCC